LFKTVRFCIHFPMDQFLKKLTDSADNASALARSITESGLKSVNEAFRGINLFSSLSSSSDEHVDYDETHYLLIPLLGSDKQYAIYTKRLLPPDTGVINSLPKQRIFHLPDAQGKKFLEQQLIDALVTERADGNTGSSDLAYFLPSAPKRLKQVPNSSAISCVNGISHLRSLNLRKMPPKR